MDRNDGRSGNKLWGGRFSSTTSTTLDRFNASILSDYKLWRYDIDGSLIHCLMLKRIGVLTKEEADSITNALNEIAKEIETGKFEFSIHDEDIHMAIEMALIRKIGDVGKKLHTARSRNDQVALDLCLYVREKSILLQKKILDLMDVLLHLASFHTQTILPGMTHLQHAQPINFGFHMVCWCLNLKRDFDRFQSSLARSDFLPLGSGALAGTPYGNDREFLAKELGFNFIGINAMDSVSDRDFALDLLYNISIVMMHISRFCEELVLWSSSEFSFVSFSDSYCTGSSIMPQKKNPDVPELLRAKSGRAYGNLISLLVVMKGLPFSYNKDMQEDKDRVFDSVENAEISLEILRELMGCIQINSHNMYNSSKKGHLCATDLADFLVQRKNIPFRSAHRIVGELVSYAESKGRDLSDLDLEDILNFNPHLDASIKDVLSLENSMNSRDTLGGTSTKQTQLQIQFLKDWIADVRKQ